MKRRILVGIDRSRFGGLIVKNLMDLGYMSDYVNNRCNTLRRKLRTKDYDCIFLFVPENYGDIYDFISEIRAEYGDIFIIAGLYRNDKDLSESLVKSGADRCVFMPADADDVCNIIENVFTEQENLYFRHQIADFLVKMKFPRYLSGFYYLCAAVEICVTRQEYKNFRTMDMYQEIADKMGVSACCVERSLRHFSSASLYRSSVASALKTKVMGNITNTKLISKTARMCAKEYELIGENNLKSANTI